VNNDMGSQIIFLSYSDQQFRQPITTISTGSPKEEEGILSVSLADFIGSSMLAYQEDSLLPDVILSQLSSSFCVGFLNDFMWPIHKSIVNIVDSHLPCYRLSIFAF
jgi:hypothetical protein